MTSAASPAPGIEVTGLTVRYGAFAALDDLVASIPAGQIVGVVGPNGAGKTTLLNAVSGFTHVSGGTITLGDRQIQTLDTRRRVELGVVRGFQTVRLMERESVLVNVLVGAQRLEQPHLLSQLLALPAQRRASRRDLERAWEVIELLGLEEVSHRPVDELPFASRRLVEAARVLVSRPTVILLDEPAAGLDRRGRNELASVLVRVHDQYPSTMVIVEHDVDLVKSLCSHALALDAGKQIHSGTPHEVFAEPRVQLAYFGRSADARAR
jgi:branched-chain amino acid transport system ATP-binding protein